MVTKNQSTLKNAILEEMRKLCDSTNTEDFKHKMSIKKLCQDLFEEGIIDMNEVYSLEVSMFGILNLINNIK